MSETQSLRVCFWVMFGLVILHNVLLWRLQTLSRASLLGWQRTAAELTRRNEALWLALNGLAVIMGHGGPAGEAAANLLAEATKLLDEQITQEEREGEETHASRNGA